MIRPSDRRPDDGPPANLLGDRCPHCRSADLHEVACESGPHHARSVCAACGRHIRFLPTPMSAERAWRFKLWFGKYGGQTLGELAESPAGRAYLAWLAREVATSKAGRAATIVLDGWRSGR